MVGYHLEQEDCLQHEDYVAEIQPARDLHVLHNSSSTRKLLGGFCPA